MITAYNPPNAPKVLGPYCHAIAAGPFLFVSGQLPINPESGLIETCCIEKQTLQVLKNLKIILEEAGTTFSQVVRCELFLKDMNDFPRVNKLYEEQFNGSIKPARQTIEVSKLPLDALLEISLIAYIG